MQSFGSQSAWPRPDVVLPAIIGSSEYLFPLSAFTMRLPPVFMIRTLWLY